MRLRETLGCLGQSLLIVVVGAALGVLLALLVADYLKLPEWVSWVVKALMTGLTTLGVIATLRQYARKCLPPDQPVPSKGLLSEEEQELVASIQFRVILLALLTGFGLGIASVLILPPFQEWVYARSTETRFFIATDPWIPFLPMLFFGMLLGGLLGEPIGRRMAGDQWLAIRDVVYEPLGYELSNRLSWLWYSLLALCLVPVLLWFDNYARFTDQGVYLNRFWSLRERFYAHSEVEAIAELTRYRNWRTGEVERDTQPYYEARLRDGTVFSTASLRPRYDDKTHQLMRWWSEKASVPIREATRGVDW